MVIHYVFDLLAIAAGVLANYMFHKAYHLQRPAAMPKQHVYMYLLVLLLGMVAGSVLFGSLNTYLAGMSGTSKSLLGGIAGAVLVAEIFKKQVGVQGSTGLYFIPGLCVLIIVGRIGCFLAGMPDYTYGIATGLPWGVDFGDQIQRHPVQLYESISMLFFLILFVVSYRRHQTFWLSSGFYVFVLWYAGQRFLWEFLKPYPVIIWEFNLFHLLALLMIGYAVAMLFPSLQNRVSENV